MGLLALGVGGCADDAHAPATIDQETGAIATGEETGAASGADGADESGGEIVECRYVPGEEGVALYKFECHAEYIIQVSATHRESLFPAPDSLQFIFEQDLVDTLEGSYKNPLAMACCTDNAIPEDSCVTEHHRACYSDLVEHICFTALTLLEQGTEEFGDDASADAITWLGNNLQQCYNHFWQAQLGQADLCEVGHDSMVHLEPFSTEKVFGKGLLPSNELSGLLIDVRTKMGADGVQPLPDQPESCEDPSGNDGLAPPAAPPGSLGGFASPSAPTSLHVVGPQWQGETISGAGAFGEESSLHYLVNSTTQLIIDDWMMVEDQPTTVGTASVSAGVDGFSLRLEDDLLLTPVSGRYNVNPGDATFLMQVVLDGQGYGVRAANSSRIQVFQQNGGVGSCPTGVPKCLTTRAFTISYIDDADQAWELDVGSVTWVP